MTSPVKPAYAGEAMLLRWSDNHRGRTVTLELEPGNGDHPFKGLKCGENGQRMQICAVLVNESEQPVSPPTKSTPAPRVGSKDEQSQGDEAKEKKRFRELKRSAQAAMMLEKPEFRSWLDREMTRTANERGWEKMPGDADTQLKVILCIGSKRDLDLDNDLGERWDKLLASFDYRDRL